MKYDEIIRMNTTAWPFYLDKMPPYAWVRNFLTPEQCDDIVKYGKSLFTAKGKIGGTNPEATAETSNSRRTKIQYRLDYRITESMKLDLFPVTVFIGNIDLKKIKLKSEITTAFLSNTPTSIDSKNELDPESAKYILNVIGNLMHEQYKHFKLDLLNIWRNKYRDNDFQEPHIHCNSKFSFIIYEKVDKVNTVFFNPAKYLIDAINADYVYRNFTPQLKTGQIIIFPSYVEHMVNKNSDQVTISGNLGFKWTQ